MVINLLGPIHSSTSLLLPARQIFILRSQRTWMQILLSIQQRQGHSCSQSSPTSCLKALITLFQECWRKSFCPRLFPRWKSLQHRRSLAAFPFSTLFALASRLITSPLSEPPLRNFAVCWQMNSRVVIFLSSLKRVHSFPHSILSLCAQ